MSTTKVAPMQAHVLALLREHGWMTTGTMAAVAHLNSRGASAILNRLFHLGLADKRYHNGTAYWAAKGDPDE